MTKTNRRKFIINALMFIVLPFFINIVLESLGNKSVFAGFVKLFSTPYIFFCNVMIIAFTLSFSVFLGRFRYFGISIISFVWLFLGMVNCILLTNRVLPLSAYDLGLLETLPIIIRKYLSPTGLACLCLAMVMIVLGMIVLFLRILHLPKIKCKGAFLESVITFAVVTLVMGASVNYGISSGILKTRFPELAKAYSENGFAYSFTLSVVDSGVNEVDGYSKELMLSIKAGFDKGENEDVKRPNIIFVQLESFFDLNALKGVEFSANPVPNLTKLKKENPSGLITVPIVGAGTVNTEFEIITGMRLADFGSGEYPYRTILTETTCESLAYNLKNHGYTSHFIHNYRGSFYGRDKVYSKLGYDMFYSLEYMSGYEETENGWPKDKMLTEYIISCLDSTKGTDLVNAVSVQGHGKYNITSGYKKHLKVKKCPDNSNKAPYEYYANQIFEMDGFIGELINALSKRDEDIILVIYGDHFPSLGIESSELTGRTIYQTDYIIWNNMGLTYEDEDMYAYQLSSKILSSVNVHDGMINSCHQTYKGDEKYLFNLRALEYDMLYGNRYVYGGSNPYSPSKMRINRREMKILSVTKKDDEKRTYLITGEGFSRRSCARVGYMVLPTRYINEQTLEFKYALDEIDSPVSVWEKDMGASEKFVVE